MELLLIRHAEPIRLEVTEGQPDPDLTERGVEQAALLAAWVDDEPIDALYSSTMRRARSTVAPLAQRRGLPVPADPDLVELTFGESIYLPFLEGQDTDHPVVQMWARRLANQRDDEVVLTFRRTVVAAIRRVIDAHPDGTAAVVCHGGVVNAVLTTALGVPDTIVFDLDYTSISRVRVTPTGRWLVRSVNEAAHLRPLRRPA